MSPEVVLALAAAALGGLALLCLWLAMRALRRERLVEDLPTSKAAGVFIGLVECSGTAESEAPFRSFLAELPCVHHAWRIDEHWRRTVTETTTDSKGRVQTRTRVETGTTTVASGGDSGPFWLKDETGVVRILPEGADLRTQRVFHETVGIGDPLYHGKGPATVVANSTHRRTFSEQAIPLHAPIYVIGRSRLNDHQVAPEIAEDVEAPLFVISTGDEESVRTSFGWAFWGWSFLLLVFAFGLLCIGLLAGVRASGRTAELGELLTPGALIGFAVGFLTVWSIAWVWTVHNALIGLRQRTLRGDTLIDIELQRRAELIPRLAEIVEATAAHESETQRAAAALRAQGSSAVTADDPDARGVAPVLRAVAESYPELVANDTFLALQRQLAETEDRIARARAYANELAANYNTRLERVPDGWIASLAGLPLRPMFAAADFERLPVEVELVE